MTYTGSFQAIWDLSTPALKAIVRYGERHLQYSAAVRELARRDAGGVSR